MVYAINGRINQRWEIVGDYQYRNYNSFGDLQQILLRTALQYEFNKKIAVGSGYTFSFVENYSGDNKRSAIEHRITQQLIHKALSGKFSLSQRVRVEERFLPDQFRVRFRYALAARYFIGGKQSWYLSSFDELFVNTSGTWYDQNRFFIGFGYRFNDHFRIETGNLAINQRSVNRNQLFTQFIHTFDW
ncbi:MAG: hypothetical protein RIQ47_1572 [Bacteroidota bacterium]|jgi:long-subunit fatty acid transport protein